MKKMIKMSLVAAVAVAGLSTTATASEDISYSGKLYVEAYSKTTAQNTASISGYEIDFDVTGKKKISDTLTAVVGVEADTDNTHGTNSNSANLNLDETYFAYANNGIGAKFGRQSINTPTSDGEAGEGLMATYTTGTITVAGAYFPVTEAGLTGGDTHALAVLGSAGPVNFELWNVGVTNVASNNTFVASAKVAGWTVGARLATTDYDAAATKDGQTIIVSAAGKVSSVGLSAAYLTTDKDGAAFVTDASSANTAELVNFQAKGLADAKAIILTASMPFTNTLSGAVKFGTVDFNTNDDAMEIVLQANYKLAASTTLTARYADYTQTVGAVDTDKSHARLDATYKF